MEINGDHDFSSETLAWLNSAKLKDRQQKGQFMTPKFLRTYLLEQLDIKKGQSVLDPAVGTGEFLKQASEKFPGISLSGWDIDQEILSVAKKVVPSADLKLRSGLDEYTGEKFDFVIGNPPYFELKLSADQKQRYYEVINGRPNIYGLFFKAGLDVLKPGGTLAFVVPPSMNAGAYFKNLRRYLTEKNFVSHLKIFRDSSLFIDAQTSVQVIVVKKQPGTSKHVFKIEDKFSGFSSMVLCEDSEVFGNFYKNSVSLASLGYEAVTGTTVWNQHKEKLVNEPLNGSVPLIYARNIVGGGLKLSPDERRPQYIMEGRTFTGEAIVVNRIIGGVGKGVIKAGLVKKGFVFAAENHLNVIRPIKGAKQKISIKELFQLVTAEDVTEKARTLTGNTQLSATEWTYLLPFPLSTQT